MKQRFQYIILTIALPIVLKLPEYRAYAYLTKESVESLQSRKKKIAERRELFRFYENRASMRSFFGITGLIPGHEEEMMAELYCHLEAQKRLEEVLIEEDVVEVLLVYHELKDAIYSTRPHS